MSALPQQLLGGHGRARMTADQFFAMGETDARFELVDGAAVLSPSPLPIHQLVVDELQFQLATQKRAGLPIIVFPDTDVRFDDRTVYRPDLSIYLASRLPTIPDRLTLIPDLTIEVLSVGSKPLDLITKREDYERFGVREYIAVDPDTGRVQRWRRGGQSGAVFEETAVEGDELRSEAVEGLVFDLRPLRAFSAR